MMSHGMSLHPSPSRLHTIISLLQQIPPCRWPRSHSCLYPSLRVWCWGDFQPLPPNTISTSWALSVAAAASHLLPSFLLPLSPLPPPCLLLPWEELFLGAASWDVLLGAGYHEGNVTKTVGKGYRHQEPCRGTKSLTVTLFWPLRVARVSTSRTLPF